MNPKGCEASCHPAPSRPHRPELGDPRDLPFCTGLMFLMQEMADLSLYLTAYGFHKTDRYRLFPWNLVPGEKFAPVFSFQSAMTRYA
jgi:hypothetical protein